MKAKKMGVHIPINLFLWIFENFQPQKFKKEHYVAISILFKIKSAAFFKKKPLGENFGHTFSFRANIFCQFFTVWTIVYEKVSSINPQLICGRSLVMRQESNNGNKVHEAQSWMQKKIHMFTRLLKKKLIFLKKIFQSHNKLWWLF